MNLTSSNVALLPIHTLSKLCADAGSAITSSKPTCQVKPSQAETKEDTISADTHDGGNVGAHGGCDFQVFRLKVLHGNKKRSR